MQCGNRILSQWPHRHTTILFIYTRWHNLQIFITLIYYFLQRLLRCSVYIVFFRFSLTLCVSVCAFHISESWILIMNWKLPYKNSWFNQKIMQCHFVTPFQYCNNDVRSIAGICLYYLIVLFYHAVPQPKIHTGILLS